MSEKPNHLKLIPKDNSIPVVEAPPATRFFEDAVRRKHWVNLSNGNVEITSATTRLDMFLDMVKHVLTASNVREHDPRHTFVAFVQDLKLVTGYSGEGQRFAPEDE